jgi:hypothetical protein
VLRGKSHHVEGAIDIGCVDLLGIAATVAHQGGKMEDSGEWGKLV